METKTPDPFSPSYWVAYVLGAFQGICAEDVDADSEGALSALCGNTPSDHRGGSLVYGEVVRDYCAAYTKNAIVFAQDNVVHEVGHAVARDGTEPVTMYQQGGYQQGGAPSTYTEFYLNKIRRVEKPASR